MSNFITKLWRITLAALICAILSLFVRCLARDPMKSHPLSAWTLVWSDDFSGPDGSSPDSKKWTYDLGGKGWGNQELESYTNRKENVRIEKGNLLITAEKESYTGADGIARDYTSARLKTQGLFTQTYVASRLASKSRRAKVCGPRFGCSAGTSPQLAGLSAARSTLWKTSARNPPPSTV